MLQKLWLLEISPKVRGHFPLREKLYSEGTPGTHSDAQSSAEKGSKSLLMPGSPCLPCLAPVSKKLGAALVVDRMRAHGLPMGTVGDMAAS